MENKRRTPIQERARATVEVLLEATAQILVELGYARLSTNRVARRAGVSVGTLYQYFPNKDALVEALAHRVSEGQAEVIITQLQQTHDQSLEVAIRGLIQGIIASKRVEPELAAALASEVPRNGRLDLEQATLRRVCDVASAALRRRSDIRPVDPELASFALVHSIFAVIQRALQARPELIDDDDLGEILAEMCIRYLSPDPGGS
ncbi:MAG TPA: TetR/AcrR family transcriptional regulator [Deltaproteobacteria bacterium]|nr:TetR/AcrR family transcriptional regulator [Deltaproteobacteria bacterium]